MNSRQQRPKVRFADSHAGIRSDPPLLRPTEDTEELQYSSVSSVTSVRDRQFTRGS